MDLQTRQQLIEQYRAGYDTVVAALEGITEPEYDRRREPEEWTVREIIHHLCDSEMMSGIRLRRLLAEDKPVIQGYDEPEFARKLHYDRPIATSLDVFCAVRLSALSLLERLSDAEWARTGTHSESGAYGVETWLEIYAAHAIDHAAQIRRARSTT